jgi:hypothetical protein
LGWRKRAREVGSIHLRGWDIKFGELILKFFNLIVPSYFNIRDGWSPKVIKAEPASTSHSHSPSTANSRRRERIKVTITIEGDIRERRGRSVKIDIST